MDTNFTSTIENTLYKLNTTLADLNLSVDELYAKYLSLAKMLQHLLLRIGIVSGDNNCWIIQWIYYAVAARCFENIKDRMLQCQ